MRLVRGLLIFSYGLFTIAAQTLLFREFVTAFEGNDISVGVFFGSWFLWVGLGAILIRRWDRFAETLLRHIELLFLLYVPAFIAQLLLIVQVRELAGVASYDLMSVQTLVLWALVVNAPVSLVTGVLFPVACRWIERADALAISRVYILEAAGSFAGGLAVTALLALHVPTVRVFLLLTVILLLSIGGVSLAGLFSRARAAGTHVAALGISLALALLAGAGIFTGTDDFLAQHLRAVKWGKLLPREALAGAFSTAQAEYLYGEYSGQWVAVREGSTCEALPNEEAAGRTAALTLCQNPQTKRILVIGSGLALCRSLLVLPQIEEVTWAHADGEYVRRMLDVVPPKFRVADQRLQPVTGETRRYLRQEEEHFDLAIVNLPDVTGSAYNRYYTLEFYQRLKASLRTGGVVAVSIAGGENVLGAELAGLGASAKMTLESVFRHLILVPGDQTWLLASDSQNLTGDPATVRDRFAAIPEAQKIFPATGLLSIYLPDRAAQALQSYTKTDLPAELLLNRDARPLTHLYGLLLAARQSGASVTRLVKLLAISGWLPFVVPVLVFAALRAWALATSRRGRRPSSFDSSFLVFSTGWVGIATVITLMYSYETHFGSLYLYVGVISSLFMVGLTAGALLVGGLIAVVSDSGRVGCAHHQPSAPRESGGHGPPYKGRSLLIGVLLVHAVLLAALAYGLGAAKAAPVLTSAGHGFFAVAFILSGLCCGGYWPIAAAQLAGGTLNPGEAGSRLETADHLGACLGGLVTSLLLVPVLGIGVSLLVVIGLLLANLPAAAFSWKRQAVALTDDGPGLRQVGYALLGVGACVVVCSNVLARTAARLQPSLPESAVRALVPEQQTRQTSVTLKGSNKRATYFTVLDAEQKPAGYLFSSADFAPEVRGFGGRFNLAVRVDASGKLLDILIVKSNETPSYLDLLRDWLVTLKGKALFVSEPFRGVQAVTGATVSSEAVLTALRLSGRRFAVEAVAGGLEGQEVATAPAQRWMQYLPDPAGWYLLGALVAAFVVAHWGGFWSRLVVLGLTFVFGGIVLNAQYSSEQIATLLSLDTPAAGLTGAFLLAAGVPVLVLLFGNLYCGYVCPFGAAQELLGHVLPRRLKPAPDREEMRLARFIKYLVLMVLIGAFFLARDRRTLAGDPLVSVFGLRTALSAWPAWMFAAVGVALLGSFFYARPWCRYLCPVGAFLSLLNHVRLLQRLVPAKRFGQCEFGLTASDHLDCLSCDRCRHSRLRIADCGLRIEEGVQRPAAQARRALVLGVVIVGVFVAGVSLNRFRQVVPLLLEEPAPMLSAGGQPRDVDVQRIRTLIQQGQLSDRKAEYYKQVE